MRDRLLEALADSDYIEREASKRGFLVYLMGPYKSYPPYDSPTPEETAVATTRPTLDGAFLYSPRIGFGTEDHEHSDDRRRSLFARRVRLRIAVQRRR